MCGSGRGSRVASSPARRARPRELLADAERYLASREWELGPVDRELVTLDE